MNFLVLQTKNHRKTGIFPFWHDQREHRGTSQVTSTSGAIASSEANATAWCSLAAFLLQHLFGLKYQCTNKQPCERSAVSKKQVKQHIRKKFLHHRGPYQQHHRDTTSYRYFYVSSHHSLHKNVWVAALDPAHQEIPTTVQPPNETILLKVSAQKLERCRTNSKGPSRNQVSMPPPSSRSPT